MAHHIRDKGDYPVCIRRCGNLFFPHIWTATHSFVVRLGPLLGMLAKIQIHHLDCLPRSTRVYSFRRHLSLFFPVISFPSASSISFLPARNAVATPARFERVLLPAHFTKARCLLVNLLASLPAYADSIPEPPGQLFGSVYLLHVALRIAYCHWVEHWFTSNCFALTLNLYCLQYSILHSL